MLQWYISDVSTICHLLFVSADLFKADKQKYFMQQVVKLKSLAAAGDCRSRPYQQFQKRTSP